MKRWLGVGIVFAAGVCVGNVGAGIVGQSDAGAQESVFEYTRVRHIGWVTWDIEKTASMLEQLGFTRVRVNPADRPSRGFDRYYHGQPVDHELRQGFWKGEGDTSIELLTPTIGKSEWADFLEQHGEGIHHLAFTVPDLDREIAKFITAGWEVLQSGKWPNADGYGAYVYLRPVGEAGPVFELITRVTSLGK